VTSKRPSDIVGERVKKIRQDRRWTAEALAMRCPPEITRSVIANIETGRRDAHGQRRRDVTVDELVSLAHALEVAPILLLAPLSDDESLKVAPGVELGPLDAAPWLADDDAILGLGREMLVLGDERPDLVERQQDRTRAALTLVRLMRMLARAIRVRDKRLSSEAYRRRYPNSLNEDNRALTIYGMRLHHLAEWLASLGYSPPALPDVDEILRRRDVPDVGLAADPFGEAPLEYLHDPAIDLLQEGEVPGDGARL
jgi:transcriptional regulator with XRE-family HTH domain